MGFLDDKKIGEEYQEFIANNLNSLYSLKLTPNTEFKGIDLVSEELEVEVKYDRRMRETGNIFIEYECNGKESGVFKYSPNKNGLFIYGDYNSAYVFNLNSIKAYATTFIEDKRYKLINAGDGWRVKGILIPISDLEKIAQSIIFFNNTIGVLQPTLNQSTTETLTETTSSSRKSITTTVQEELKCLSQEVELNG